MTLTSNSYMTGSTTTVAEYMPGMCYHCSTEIVKVFHNGPCPRVKAIDYYANGSVKRVEYFRWDELEKTTTVADHDRKSHCTCGETPCTCPF